MVDSWRRAIVVTMIESSRAARDEATMATETTDCL